MQLVFVPVLMMFGPDADANQRDEKRDYRSGNNGQ